MLKQIQSNQVIYLCDTSDTGAAEETKQVTQDLLDGEKAPPGRCSDGPSEDPSSTSLRHSPATQALLPTTDRHNKLMHTDPNI